MTEVQACGGSQPARVLGQVPWQWRSMAGGRGTSPACCGGAAQDILGLLSWLPSWCCWGPGEPRTSQLASQQWRKSSACHSGVDSLMESVFMERPESLRRRGSLPGIHRGWMGRPSTALEPDTSLSELFLHVLHTFSVIGVSLKALVCYSPQAPDPRGRMGWLLAACWPWPQGVSRAQLTLRTARWDVGSTSQSGGLSCLHQH